MSTAIGCIVEGHGDRKALPVLLRRIALQLGREVDFPQPITIPKTKLLKDGELERAVQLAALRAAPRGAIVVLLDSDDDCPAELGPKLLKRATSARSDAPIAVVLAHREFESWFLAAAESLRGERGLPLDLSAPASPEAIRGAKE